jgi:mannosylglycerate hydrolase
MVRVQSLFEGDKVTISSLPELFARVRATLVNPAVLKGEMRCTQKDESGARLYASTLSSRIPLKQMNRKAEDSLIHWAEPFSAIAWTFGAAYPDTALTKAWKYLLTNHAHDSISGTGTDAVHADVVSRFTQCELMAAELTRRALSDIVSRIDDPAVDDGDVLLTVFNPLPFPRDEVVRLDLDLSEQDASDFHLCDARGNAVPYHADPPIKTVHTVHQTHGFPYRFIARRHRLWLRAESIPAMGYATYLVKKGPCSAMSGMAATETDRVEVNASNRMENRFVAVQIHPNGTMTVEDKLTGRCYENLNLFEDAGEVGDAYEHRSPRHDRVVTSQQSQATIELAHKNPLTASFVIRLAMDIPECAVEDKTARVSRCRACEIVSRVTLAAGSPAIEIVAHVDNTAKDHRLRVLFPTGLRARECWAETQFDVQSRTVTRPSSEGWLEPPCPTQPQLGFVDLADGETGLAVFSHGLPEYEIIDDGRNTIAVTLLRCFTHETRATRTDDPTQVGAQCPGRHEFRYAVFPHSGGWREGKVFKKSLRHHQRVKVLQSWRPAGKDRQVESLPLRRSFLQLVPDDLVLSAVKRAENGRSLIVRCFNPTEHTVEGELQVHCDVTRALYMDLEENPLCECALAGKRSARLVAGPKKIITVGLELGLTDDSGDEGVTC